MFIIIFLYDTKLVMHLHLIKNNWQFELSVLFGMLIQLLRGTKLEFMLICSNASFNHLVLLNSSASFGNLFCMTNQYHLTSFQYGQTLLHNCKNCRIEEFYLKSGQNINPRFQL